MFLPAPQRLFEDEILLALLPSRARFLLRRAAIPRRLPHSSKLALREYEACYCAARAALMMLSVTRSREGCRPW
jgi:hypothetical protein